jgi:LysR family transcriptional regulator, regulator for bpeEF and oprC
MSTQALSEIDRTGSTSIRSTPRRFADDRCVRLAAVPSSDEAARVAASADRMLHVYVPGSIGRRLIAPALPRFLYQHPELRISLSQSSDLPEQRTDELQLAVCVGMPADAKRVVQQVGMLRTVTCAAPDFIACNGAPWTPAELSATHCIGLAGPQGVRHWTFTRRGAWHSLTPAAAMVFDETASAVAAAVRGGGYIQALSVDVSEEVAAGLLQPVLTDWHDKPCPVSVVHAPGAALSDAARTFCDFLTALFPCGSPSADPIRL